METNEIYIWLLLLKLSAVEIRHIESIDHVSIRLYMFILNRFYIFLKIFTFFFGGGGLKEKLFIDF